MSKKIPKDFKDIYNRTTCQKCNKPISKKRIADTKKRRFWPICKKCEKIVIPMYQEAQKKMKEGMDGFFKK